MIRPLSAVMLPLVLATFASITHGQEGLAQPSSAAAKPAATVNINTATADQLTMLPGIGDRTAARIVEFRQKNGPFKKVEDLMNVRGVGEKSFLKLKPMITVGAKPAERAAGQQ